MKKKKVGVIASSVAAIAVCSSMVVGSTFALFTSEDTVNIAVTSGKVDITASVDANKEGTSTFGGAALGGFNTANGLALENIAPGDIHSFKVVAENHSTISVKYRTTIEFTNALLASALDVTVGDVTYSGLTKYTTAWTEVDGDIADLEVTVAFPALEENQNKFQDLKTDIVVKVEGVQANAETTDEELVVISASTGERLAKAISQVKDVKATINLVDDIALGEKLFIKAHTADLTINGNGHSITATENFKAIDKDVSDLYQLVKIDATETKVTLNDIKLEHRELNVSKFYHTLDVFGSRNVELNNVTLVRNFGSLDNMGNSGAPLVINTSNVTANNLRIVAGGNAWYGINVDARGVGANLTLNGDFLYVNNDTEAVAVCCEHFTDDDMLNSMFVDNTNGLLATITKGVDSEGNTVAVTNVKTFTEVEGQFLIESANDLFNFAKVVNSGNDFAGKTVLLANDIDLAGINWTPIGTKAVPFAGAFDGNNHIVSNLSIAGFENRGAGLFGCVTDTTIKNVTVENAKINGVESVAAVVGNAFRSSIDNCHVIGTDNEINGAHWVGGIVGYIYGHLTNCSVENISITATPNIENGAFDNGDKVGGIAGYMGESNYNLTGNTATNVKVKGFRDVGGIVGYANGSNVNVSGNTVNGAIITMDKNTNAYSYAESKFHVGEVAGFAGKAPVNNTVTNVTIETID